MKQEVPGGQHDQELGVLPLAEDLLLAEALDDGQGEGECLARAGLVLGLDVSAGQDVLEGTVLYGKERLDALALEQLDRPLVLQEELEGTRVGRLVLDTRLFVVAAEAFGWLDAGDEGLTEAFTHCSQYYYRTIRNQPYLYWGSYRAHKQIDMREKLILKRNMLQALVIIHNLLIPPDL